LSALHRACLVAYWMALSLWTSAIIAAGVCAAFVFGTLPGLSVTLAEYSAFHVEGDAQAHGRLAAGMILERVFTAVDFAQLALGAITAAALIVQIVACGASIRRLSNLIRATAIAAAIVIASMHIFFQAPAMNRELRAYWSAAREGDVASAEAHRLRFDEFHPRAEFALRANLVLLLTAIAASAVALSSSPMVVYPEPARPALEPPALLRDMR
jgi:hypothetical protein